VAGLLDRTGQSMHDRQGRLDSAPDWWLLHAQSKKSVGEGIASLTFASDDVSTLFEHEKHAENLAARTAHPFRDCVDAQRSGRGC
jgi:hypothetical protein